MGTGIITTIGFRRSASTQGRTEKLNRGEGSGKTEGGRKLIKNKNFCEILNKMSKKGGAKDRRPPPPSVRQCVSYLR